MREGFRASERRGDLTVRWTTGEAVLDLPCLPVGLREAVSVTLRTAASRPDGFPPVRLVMEVDGEAIGEWQVSRDFQVVEARVEGVTLQGAGRTLTLRSDTWVPQQHGVSTDSRTLGVVLDWIAISAAESSQ